MSFDDARIRQEEIRGQIESLGFLTRKRKREIHSLPDVLAPDETVWAATTGYPASSQKWTLWLIVCTDRRVLALNKGPL